MMKKPNLLLLMVMAIIFAGGFFTGVLYFTNNEKKHNLHSFKMNILSKVKSNPKYKEMPKLASKHSKVLIGYVQDFRDPDVVDYSKLTHVVFSFVHPTKEGNLLFNGKMAMDHLHDMVLKAHKHGTKIFVAVGGWYSIQGGESYEYFKTAISNPASRSRLVDELDSLMDRENLDGIDIDFEHPRSQEDAIHLLTFTKELSDRIHKEKKELSIAVHSKINSVTGSEARYVVYKSSLFDYVDYVNIMAYDGQWDGEYNAANLSPYPFTENIVNYWTSFFEEHNLSKEKLVLGVPFYAQPENPAIKQISYAAIINNNPANANQDSVQLNGTTYHYNGSETIKKKTKLALDHGFGGMMLWEAGHDAVGSNSLTGILSNFLVNSNNQFVKQ